MSDPTNPNDEGDAPIINMYRLYEADGTYQNRQSTMWPPPLEINRDGKVYQLETASTLDDDAARHPNVMRGCTYRVMP